MTDKIVHEHAFSLGGNHYFIMDKEFIDDLEDLGYDVHWIEFEDLYLTYFDWLEA